MALHYWDATDYTTTMEYPEELRKKEECDVKEPIDRLCFAINEHYPWDFNFKKRWFGGKQVPEKFTTVDFFSPKKVEYTPTQKGMVEGKINPRSSENLFFKGNAEDEDKSWGVMSLFYQGMEVNPYQNWQKISKHPNMMNKNSLTTDEIDTVYGSSRKKTHWISKEERNCFKGGDLQEKANTHNKTLPHYQYARALLKKGTNFFPDYVSTYNSSGENSMEKCHNTMHNNMQFFLIDGEFSITNTIFFLFHSWIDLALETRIRMIRSNTEESQQEFYYADQYLNKPKPPSILDIFSKECSQRSSKIKWGDYKIFEWVTPEVREKYEADKQRKIDP